MFGSEILEVALGLILVYLLLSLMCSILSEWIARVVALRSNTLDKALQNLLGDPAIVKQLYNHPLVKGLSQKGLFDKLFHRESRPSYISTHTFSLVLMDIMTPDGLAVGADKIQNVPQPTTGSTSGKDEWKKALRTLINAAQSDFDKSQKNIEDWFDDAMSRLSGKYKRITQTIILVLALLVSVVLNADTFTIANTLWRDPTLRASVVAIAEKKVSENTSATSDNMSLTRITELQSELNQLELPFGWIASGKHIDPREVPGSPLGWFYKVLGLLATALALTLGAPFWFDTLNKFVNLRGTVKPPAEKEGVAEQTK